MKAIICLVIALSISGAVAQTPSDPKVLAAIQRIRDHRDHPERGALKTASVISIMFEPVFVDENGVVNGYVYKISKGDTGLTEISENRESAIVKCPLLTAEQRHGKFIMEVYFSGLKELPDSEIVRVYSTNPKDSE